MFKLGANPLKRTKRILIVEDEKPITFALNEELQRYDFSIVSTTTGDEGLNVALKLHPDIIILDLLLPKVSGIGMLEQLRKDKWGKGASVIILTNLSDEKVRAHALELGAKEYIIKTDTTLETLANKVHLYLR